MIIALVYLLAITLAELVTVITQTLVLWGIISYAVILAALILHSALAKDSTYRQFLLSMALVPLVRILSLSLPLVNIPRLWWEPIIYLPLLVAAVQVVRLLGWRLGEVGLNIKMPLVQIAVMLSGFGLGIIEYFILKPEARIAELTISELWFPAIILLLTTGLVEEFIFRGVMQRAALQRFGGWGIVYVSLLFAILHMGFLSWLDGVFVFVVALFFGWVVNKTGSLFGVTLSHGITNIMLFLVVPFFF